MRWASFIALACAIAWGGVSTSQGAIITNVNPPIAPGEEGIQQILNHVYGPGFTPSGSDFSNGTISAIRLDDAVDQIWQGNFQAASVKTIFADFKQEFGYISGASGGSYVKLLDGTGTGYSVGPASTSLLPVGTDPIRWARDGDGELFTSLPSNNSDGLDHLVTYRIDGLDNAGNGVQTWLLFWEDLPNSSACPDFDYNDLVVQITALGVPSVPEPVSLAPLMGLALLGVRRSKR